MATARRSTQSDAQPPMPRIARAPHAMKIARGTVWLLAFLCAAFTVCAGCFLLLASAPVLSEEGGRPYYRLLAKSAGFAVIALVSLWRFARNLKTARMPASDPSEDSTEDAKRSLVSCWRWWLPALAIAALMVLPRLHAYPHAEPDEIHHLIVARNLAAYGLYATGHPALGFEKFDDYDSVGPPVILPIAAIFRLAGSSLAGARAIMATYFLALCIALFALIRPVLGDRAAALGLLLMSFSFGSTYLGRTLYGEVPALFFVALALLCWRAALTSGRPWRYGLLSGLAFGCALLCKYFLIVGAWALLGAWLIDRVTARRIRWDHLAPAAIATLAVLLTWFAVQEWGKGQAAGAAMGIAAMYQHNLLFGLSSLPQTAGWLLRQPATLLVMTASFGWGMHAALVRRYDPPTLVLLLLAPYLAFWWVFFTPGNIPRYMWYTCAVLGLFSGQLALAALDGMRTSRGNPIRIAGFLFLIAIIAIPAAGRLQEQGVRVFARDEMRDDRELARILASMPEKTHIGTTVWPLEGAMNFLAGRAVTRLSEPNEAIFPYDAVIIDRAGLFPLPSPLHASNRQEVGSYVILFPGAEPPRHSVDAGG